MNRLSVRLFASYLAVVLVSTGVAFVTARALAPTFFRVNLEQGRPDTTPGSTMGPGGRTSSDLESTTTDADTDPGTSAPDSSGTSAPGSTTGSTQRQGQPGTA